MITADQLLCHAFGDYVIQSDWMAQRKTASWWAALAHALTYALPFLFLAPSPAALAVIVVTHLLIDHWRLARYLCWLKNWLSPVRPQPWSVCKATGYDPERPTWMSVWLMIICDNAAHILINGLALRYLA